MKIHNYFCELPQDLCVYIPVRCYELTLNHRLLQQLGGFSHLLLEALYLLPDKGCDWVSDVTGLNSQQLEMIFYRLNGLGLMNQGRLTARGKQLSIWRRLLHGQTRSILLDGNYRERNFVGDRFLELVELGTDVQFVIRPWQKNDNQSFNWACNDWNEDCERQKQRILCSPIPYLRAVFDTFEECFNNSNQQFNVDEWNLSVRYVDMPDKALKAGLNSNLLHSGTCSNYMISSPVLCLETRYRLPDGVPAKFGEGQPQNQRHILRFMQTGTTCTDHLLNKPGSEWIWPVVDESERMRAIENLFTSTPALPDPTEAFFNREHELIDCWQMFSISESSIEDCLKDIKGIHLIRDNA